MYPKSEHFRTRTLPFGIVLAGVLLVALIGLACAMPTAGSDTSGTQVALNVQSTQLARKQTEVAAGDQGQGAQPQQPETESGPDLQATLDAMAATQMALDLQATTNAIQLTQAAQSQTDTQNTTQQQPEQPAQPASNLPDFDTWMRSASILLFEDMAADFSVYRFIELALEGMSLQTTDVRDALGIYKTQLLSGGPGGQGWDLIISGKELRTAVQGEFYVYLNDSLNLGSSVIIEEWDMDAIGAGKLSTILSRCGVEFQEDWFDEDINEQLLYAINGTHPIHHFPNEGISLTNPNNFWDWTDQGDLMRLVPGSNAQLLWGARTNQKTSSGTAVVCLDGQLIIQSYSTHSYGQDRIVRMWQNYIYNALQARYRNLGGTP
jgi:hypothetical protein